MKIQRNEIRTGLLVVVTLAALVAVLLYLGAPGVFVKQNTYRVYFDNASGMKPGNAVLLAGRRVGHVTKLYSPVPESQRPEQKYETVIELSVNATANIYRDVKVQMVQTTLLGETVIDFTSGFEASGLAPDGAFFLGERPAGLADAVPQILSKIDPVLVKATATFDSLQKTTDNLTKITAEGSDLPEAFSAFKEFGNNLVGLSGEDGSLRRSLTNIEEMTGDGGRLDKSLANIEQLTGPGSDLARTLKNTQKFTHNLANNQDLDATLRNFRRASLRLDRTMDDLSGQFAAIGKNLEQATDTVKRQPWRLIWPTTKRYEEDGRASPPQARLGVTNVSSPERRTHIRLGRSGGGK